MIKQATHEDKFDFVAMLQEYYQETAYKDFMTLDCVSFLEILTQSITDDIVLVSELDGKKTGFCIINFYKTFFKEHEANISLFYVRPEHRKSGISRELAKQAVDLAASRKNVKIIHTATIARIDEKSEAQFVNMFAKLGFDRCGANLQKRTNHGEV